MTEKAFPLEWLRDRFPSLSTRDDGNARVHLDNPAGTQVPLGVADAIHDAILHRNANLGGAFTTSQRAGEVIREGHAAMADFYNCSEREVIIGANMTSLTYHFSRMIGERLDGEGFKPGDEIIVTQMDHEGNVSPWLQLAEDKGLTIRKLPFSTESWQIEPETLSEAITPKTRLLALSCSSNLTGSINDIAALTQIARAQGVVTYLDAVQFAPHVGVDVQAIGCDFLVSSSYKYFGPHLGILYGREDMLERLDPYKCRCSDNALPGRFETGTPQIELVAGLSATVDHFAELGAACGAGGSRRERVSMAFEASVAHEQELAARLIEGLGTFRGLTIHGITDRGRLEWRVPTVSFTLSDVAPAELVARMAEEGIFCWSGHNYAWEVVHQLGIDPAHGVVRIGIANYNTAGEIDRTLESVERNLRMLRQEH